MLRAEAAWPVDAELVDPVAVDVEGDVDAAVSRMPAAELAVPVVERGELLGVLTIAKPRGERVSDVDVDLVHRLAAASGVVLRNLRLDAELAQRLEDLEASRRRLVSAQDDARRRIEAELAGGARAALDLVRDRLTELVADVDAVAAPKTAMLLGQLVDATDGALGTLAGLAAGVYPPRLAADGLVVALTEQAGKAALPVEVHADGVGRYPPEVEAAAYFAVLEALQNVAKYADATSAHVRLTDHDNALSFEVVDDGTGFDPATTIMGSGLQGITDRLDTVGGALTIASSPGAGTTITGHVPSAPSTAASVDVASKLAGVAS
jgi:signal transduction histidine kinase